MTTAAAARIEPNWLGVDHALSVLLEAVFFIDKSCNPATRLRDLFRYYGYIGICRLLETNELPPNGIDGFRIYYCGSTTDYIDFVRRQDGSIYAHSLVATELYKFESSIKEPDEYVIGQYQAMIDHLLAS